MTEMFPGEIMVFEELHARGMQAKNTGDHNEALRYFQLADNLASRTGDKRKRLDALNPAARALWSLGHYEEATDKLEKALHIATQLELKDEQGIAVSNLGRLAAVKIVKTVPVEEQAGALSAKAIPIFFDAYTLLENHPHLYFRYANATHGSVVAALGGEKQIARTLINDGLRVSRLSSPEPYDQKTPAEISPNGLKQLRAARFLLLMGNQTPILAKKARENYVR